MPDAPVQVKHVQTHLCVRVDTVNRFNPSRKSSSSGKRYGTVRLAEFA